MASGTRSGRGKTARGRGRPRKVSEAIIVDSEPEDLVRGNDAASHITSSTEEPNIQVSDDEELPATITLPDALAAHGTKRKSSDSEAIAQNPAPAAPKDKDTAPKVTYHLKIAEASDLRKPPAKRTNKARILKRDQSVTFEDLQDAVIGVLANVLDISTLTHTYKEFEVLFTIPRKILDPVPLKSADDYEVLLNSIKGTKEPVVFMFICQLQSNKRTKRSRDKENRRNDGTGSSDSNSSDSDGRDSSGDEKRKKKTTKQGKKGKEKKKPKAGLEDEVVGKVKLLRERWQCSVADGSDYCYWTDEEPKHYALKHDHFRSWAQALLKHDDEIATVEKPPNNNLFSDLAPTLRSNGSPLLQRRLNAMKTTSNSVSSMPVIHLHMPDTNPQPNPSLSPATSTRMEADKPLVNGTMGADLKIEDFCRIHELDDALLDRLKENGFRQTKTFKRITLGQLREMGFKHGEIGSLQDAVEERAVADNVL